jgi:hypothetical protein
MDEDNSLNVALGIENVGKEPATGVVWRTADPILTDYVPEHGSDDSPGPSNDNTSCSGIHVDGQRGLVIYPTAGTPGRILMPFSLPHDANSANIVAAAKAMKGSMYIDGCIAYWTGEATHTSRFRFLWRSVKGIPPDAWNFQPVNTGNHAD